MDRLLAGREYAGHLTEADLGLLASLGGDPAAGPSLRGDPEGSPFILGSPRSRYALRLGGCR